MKTRILFLAAILSIATLNSYATVRTVSNHPLGGAQYNTLQAAYTAAVNGDTLILEGTDIVYYSAIDCAGNWTKSLTVIGAGFNPDKQNNNRTKIQGSGCYGQGISIHSSAAGTTFYGIVFIDYYAMHINNTNNITFEDCLFQVHVQTDNSNVSNIVFRNCVFDRDNTVNLDMGNYASTTYSFINCAFDGFILGNNNALNTILVDHCIFLSTSTGSFSQVKNASVSNCIFMNQFPSGISGCTFLNNICAVPGTLPPAGNYGSGNISNTNPMLVSYTAGSLYSSSQDYHLQTGSPCLGTGSDGTDIGIHGGLSDFNEHGEPLIAPVVRSIFINNTTVAPNGTLDVDVSASKPNDD